MIGQRVVLLALAALCSTASAEHLRRLKVMSAADFKAEMLQTVNAARANEGKPPLCYNSKLLAASQGHSDDQARMNQMTHDGSNGSTLVKRIVAQTFAWSGVAENVAAGQPTVADVMDSWMKSEGHHKNLMGDYKFFGMGYTYTDAKGFHHFWTQDFGSSNGDEVCEEEEAANEADVIPASEPETPYPTPEASAPVPEPEPETPAPEPETAAPEPEPTPAPTPEPETAAEATPEPTKGKLCDA